MSKLLDGQINELGDIHTHREYYSALKRNKILTQASNMMSREDVMLSEIHQSQKGKYYTILLISTSSRGTRTSRIHGDRN